MGSEVCVVAGDREIEEGQAYDILADAGVQK